MIALPSRPPARGVTLVELLVATAISGIVMVGIIAMVTSQQQAYAGGHRVRAAQSSGRNAILTLEQLVPLAGYGMAPSLALDFGRYTTGPCPAQLQSGGACQRDRTDDSDELVFYARNPSYWIPPTGAGTPTGKTWTVTTAGVTTTHANLAVRGGERFRKGQILQIVCEGAAQYVYVTLKANTTAPAAAGTLALELEESVTADPFRRQDAATDDCFEAGTARAYLVDRYRLHVRPVAVGDRLDPFLVLDRGVDVEGTSAAIDAADEEFVAEGIESFQVAYVLANGQVVGATAGTGITFATTAAPGSPDTTETITKLTFPGAAPEIDESVYSPTSWYRYLVTPPDPERLTDHQANIRAVRIAIVARSPDPDATGQGTPPLLRLNQSAPASWAGAAGAKDGYERVAFEVTIPLPNMLAQGMVYF